MNYPNNPNLLHPQRKATMTQKNINKKIREFMESLSLGSLGFLILNNSNINPIIESITTLPPVSENRVFNIIFYYSY